MRVCEGEDDVFTLTGKMCLYRRELRRCDDCRHALPEQGIKERCVILLANLQGAFTLEEIGQRLGLTRERIRQIEKSALKKLGRKVALKDILADLKGEI